MSPWVKLIVSLQGLSQIYRVAHWVSRGPTSYSDHLLFERLYTTVASEIDQVAEKAVGMGVTPEEMTPFILARGTSLFVRGVGSKAPGAFEALSMEAAFRVELNEVMRTLAPLGKGVDNLLAGIADKHEEHQYLLQQRIK